MREYTGEEGLRALYCHVRDILNYAQLEQLAGVPVFLSGPHSDGKLRVQEHSFGYYNPAFITWFESEFLPSRNDRPYLALTRPLYDQYVRNMARAYHRAFVGWSENLPHFAQERAYLLEMIDGTRPWSYMGARFQDNTIKAIFDIDIPGEGLNSYHLSTALRFWQRRSIDGTADQMFGALETLIGLYDPEWLDAAPKPSRAKPILPPPEIAISAMPDPSKPWLPEPYGENFFLNSVVVIE